MSPFAVVKEVVAAVKELSRFISSERSHSSVVLFPADVDMIVTIFKTIAKYAIVNIVYVYLCLYSSADNWL